MGPEERVVGHTSRVVRYCHVLPSATGIGLHLHESDGALAVVCMGVVAVICVGGRGAGSDLYGMLAVICTGGLLAVSCMGAVAVICMGGLLAVIRMGPKESLLPHIFHISAVHSQ